MAYRGTPGPQGRATAPARRAGTAGPGETGDDRERNEVPELLPEFVPNGENVNRGGHGNPRPHAATRPNGAGPVARR